MSATVQANTYPTSGVLTQSIMSVYDAMKPQYSATLFSRYGDQYMPFFQWLRAMGRELPVANDTWYNYQENRYHRTITVNAQVASPGADTAQEIVLKSTDLDSSYNFYPRLNDIITYPNGVTGLIYDITGEGTSTITLKVHPLKAANALPQVEADQVLSITSGAFAAGTGQPYGTVVGATKFTFNAQIFKETVEAEGTTLVNELWYQVMDDNRSVKGWYSPGYLRADYLMGLKIDGAFFTGEERTSTSANLKVASGDGAGNYANTTRGMIPWLRAEGLTQAITSGSFDIKKLDECSLYLKSQGITSGVALWMQGAKLANDVENAAKTYLEYTGADFTKVTNILFGGNQEMAVALNFKAFTKGGVTYMCKVMDQWSNPVTFGATGYEYDQYGIIMPMSSFKDAKSGVTTDNILTRVRAMDGYDRRFTMWKVGAAGPDMSTYVNGIDKLSHYLRAHLGLEFNKVNQCILQDAS
jgi:hypothetical protein